MEISKIKVNNTTYDIQDSRVNASDLASILTTGGYNVSGGTTYTAGTGINISNGLISVDNSVYTTSNPPTVSPTYGNVTYSVTPTTASSTTVSLDGTTPVHVVSFSSAITGVTLSTNPSAGHSCHVLFVNTSASDLTVDITHDSTNRVCPEASTLQLTVKAGGYGEVDFLNANSKVYVRGI